MTDTDKVQDEALDPTKPHGPTDTEEEATAKEFRPQGTPMTVGRPQTPDQDGDGFLTKAGILRAEDIIVEPVEVPEWGGRVRVKALSGSERDAFESSLVVNKGKKSQYTDTRNVRAKLASMAIVGADGNPLFDQADVVKLGKKSSAALDRVFSVAMKLSKITDEDLEELVGNSEPGHSDVS